jgi:hypothetical protein
MLTREELANLVIEMLDGQKRSGLAFGLKQGVCD